jgi:DHA3 family macrolide efflux protein-like MFS transporter
MAMENQDKTSWRRDAAIFLSSQAVSLFGSALVQYAMMWHVTLSTKSGVMMTLYIIAGFVPTFLVSPLGGVWADRHDRRKLIAFADGGIALVTLVLAILFLSGHDSIWFIFAAAALRAIGQAIQGPAIGALLPQFVPEDKLMRVSGINGSIQSTIMLVSPIVSGALLAFTSLGLIFFIDVATAALAITALLGFLRIPPHARAAGKVDTGHLEDFRLGLRYVREHRYLVTFFLYLGSLLFMFAPAAFLTPLQATRSFGPEVWRLTAIEIAFSGGMMAGGALVASWGGFRNRMKTMVFSGLLMAFCTVALGLAPWFWLYLAFMAIFGLAMPFFNTPSSVMLQEHVEPEYMGRVFGFLTMLSTSLMPLGMLVFGPLADAVRIEWILLGTGGAMFVIGFLALGRKRLMEAGLPKPAGLPADDATKGGGV